MSTISPYTQTNTDMAAAANLGKLLAVGKKGHNTRDLVATDVAIKAFEDYKNATLGYTHSVKKLTAAVGVPVGLIVGGVGAVVGTVGYMLKPLFENEKTYDLPQILDHLVKSVEGISPVNVAKIAAVLTADLAVRQKFGWSPVIGTAKWAAWMLSSAYIYSAHAISNFLVKGLEQTEKDAEMLRINSKRIIFEHTKIKFDGVAQLLAARSKAVENNIKEKIEFRHLITQLYTKMPAIVKDLQKYPLQASEISLITDHLNQVLQHILETKLSVKVPQSYEDNRNNAILLSYLPENEFEGIAVPQTVDLHIDEIAENNYTLGMVHKVNSYASAVVGGALTLLTAEVALPAIAAIGSGVAALVGYPQLLNRMTECLSTPDQALTCAQSTAGIVAISALQAFSLYAGYSVYNDATSLHKLENNAAVAAVEKHTQQLRSDLERVYQGMVHYFLNGAHNVETKEQAIKILAKMPKIDHQIMSIKEIADPKAITDPLAVALKFVLKADLAQMASRQDTAPASVQAA